MVLTFKFRNDSRYALNGTQAVITLTEGISLESVSDGTATVQGRDVVVSLGRTLPGRTINVQLKARIPDSVPPDSTFIVAGLLRSGTALPVAASATEVKVVRATPPSR